MKSVVHFGQPALVGVLEWHCSILKKKSYPENEKESALMKFVLFIPFLPKDCSMFVCQMDGQRGTHGSAISFFVFVF